mgnify:CR=1 FL=1
MDYSIFLGSKTDENSFDGVEASGVRHRVTLRSHGGEPDKIKRQTEKELGYGPYDAVAYDLPVPASNGGDKRYIRMWKPEPATNLDIDPLKYFQAINTLESQYFVISASL